jgi:hypothetical protein
MTSACPKRGLAIRVRPRFSGAAGKPEHTREKGYGEAL